MGISQSSCVSLTDINHYTKESYTVKRTCGSLENDWIISNCHRNKDGEKSECPHNIVNSAWANGHACKVDQVWKVFMSSPVNIENISDHACGWRRLGTFFPTRLQNNTQEINSWQDSLKSYLDNLDMIRVSKIDISAQNSKMEVRCPHALPYSACMYCYH